MNPKANLPALLPLVVNRGHVLFGGKAGPSKCPMKQRTAVAEEPQTQTSKHPLDMNREEREARDNARREAVTEPCMKMTVEVRPESFGCLAAAGVFYKLTPEQVLNELLNRSEMMFDWANDGYPLDIDPA